MDNEEEQEDKLYNHVIAQARVKIEGGKVGARKEALTFNAVNTGPQKHLQEQELLEVVQMQEVMLVVKMIQMLF